MKEKISRKELEALLPGYVFNDLTENEKAEFETAITDHPDLEQEVKEGCEVFEKINNMDFDKILNSHTNYLPEKVIERLQKRDLPIYETRKRPKTLLLPIGIAAAAIILFFFTNKFNTNDTNSIFPKNELQNIDEAAFFSESEKSILTEEIGNYEYLENENPYYTIKDYVLHRTLMEFDNEIDEIYYAIAGEFKNYCELVPGVTGASDVNQRIMIDNIAYLNESDFQTIMENLNNETN